MSSATTNSTEMTSVVLPQSQPAERGTDDTCIQLEHCTVHPKGRAAPLVDDITMRVDKGEIFAILGPSGCGKSTLFSLLSHRLRELGNWCVYAQTFTIPKNVVLVPQHDVFFAHDTPLRALSFIYQKVKLCSDAEAEAKAMEALTLVGLDDAEKVRTKIGEAGYDSPFTGGERRLLAVARALMTEPDSILLDEPTSGLDAWTALSLVRQIKQIAAKSRTSFVFTVHQPSDALVHEFGDNVLRLTPPLPKAEPTGLSKFTYPPRESHYTVMGWFTLLWLLTRRQAVRMVVNPAGAAIQVGGAFFLAMLLGVAFIQIPHDDPQHIPDVIGYTSAAIASTFAPIVFGATLFPLEKPHFMDENPLRDTRYLLADAFARFFVDTVMSATQSLVLLLACAMIGINAVGDFWLTLWFQYWASNAFGFLMSTIAEPHISIGTLIPTVAYVSFAIGSGIMAPSKSGAGWIFHVAKWGSFFKYGVAALMLDEMPRVNGTCSGPCLYSNGYQVLDEMELLGDGFIYSTAFQRMMLVLMCLALRFLSLMTVRHLINKGAARYYYSVSSAGAVMAKPSDNSNDSNAPFGGDDLKEDAITTPTLAPDTPTNKKTDTYYKFVIGDIEESLGPKHIMAPSEQRFKRKTVLKGRTLKVQQSTFTAVLGPTGCGKSVLLQAISARLGAGLQNPPESPQIFSHGDDPINIQFDDGRDGFMPFVSVLEATMHGARLHFPKMSEDELEAHVLVHLTAFGLAPKAKDSVHKLSGGESKRLQVVTKLVTLPEILVLDEPTVGLDSDAAQALLTHLAYIATVGVEGRPITVICSLKQPEPRNIEAFDHFMFLNHDGSVMVEGDETACRTFFGIDDEHASIWADAALLRIHGQGISHLLVSDAAGSPTNDDVYELPSSPNADDCVEVAAADLDEENLQQKTLHTEHLAFGRAVVILAKRNLQQRWVRNPWSTLGVFAVRYLLLPVFFSVLLWDVGSDDPFFKNRSSLLFCFGGAHLFTTFISTAVIFPLERHIIEGEILSNQYSPLAYLAMQWLTVPLVEDIVGVCLNCVILKFCTSLNVNFGWFFLSTFVMSQAAIGYGTVFGLFRSIVIAAGLAVSNMLPMMFATGVMVTTEQMSRNGIFRAIEAVSISRMAFLISFDSELEESNAMTPFWGQYGFDNPSWWYRIDLQWILLCFWLVVMRVQAAMMFKGLFNLALAKKSK